MPAGHHPYAAVADELRGTRFSRITYLPSTASTNSDASAVLGDEAAFGTTFVAEVQSEGAGRKGRSWIAQPQTSLLMTTVLPRALKASHLWVVPFGVAICVRRALVLNGVRADLHWPNDLLLDGKKVAGILCVSRIVGDRAWVAAGVGINVHRTPGAEKEIFPPPAFCDDVNPQIDRAHLLRDILLNYEIWEETLDMPPRIARVWERQAGLPGRRYRILKDDAIDPIEVTALSLAVGGGLLVQHDDGTRETIALADARALR
ncbi:MAG TPA: biotin--[acetyl-CoA-carboxylase] ligase [Candidatus Aquilonibacter sp.]|nr:biotin--[acetyl-CoA-carboxylase] ligase [Candidatus Aquilonibacter sp.]